MKRTLISLLSLLTIFGVGCNKTRTVDPNSSQNIEFFGAIFNGETSEVNPSAVESKAGTTASKTAFVQGDLIGVFVVPFKAPSQPAKLAPSGNYADNVEFVCNAGGVFAPSVSNRITFPNASTSVSIYAFAMYHKRYNTLGADPAAQQWSVDINQTAPTAILANDLMTAQQVTVAPGVKPQLTFEHRFAMVRVELTTPAQYRGEKVLSASLKVRNVISQAVVNMTDNTVAPAASGSVKSSIEAYKFSSVANAKGGFDCVFEAIVVPQTIAAFTTGITVQLNTEGANSYDFHCDYPVAVVYGSGNLTNVKLNFDAEYTLTLTSATILPWGNGGSPVIDAVKPAYMNFTIDGPQMSKAATIATVTMGVDTEVYIATEVNYNNGLLKCAYMQPKNRVGEKLRSLILKDKSGNIITFDSTPAIVYANGINIPGDPTMDGYNKIISTLTLK